MVPRNALVILMTSLITFVSGYQMYNDHTEFCCGGAVVDGTKYNSCCGSAPYSDEEQACCDDILQDFPLDGAKHYACCGSTAYSRDQEALYCCDGVLLTAEDSSKDYVCCSGELYDAEEYECCGGTDPVLKQDNFACCGSNMYYLTTAEVCCSVDEDVDGTAANAVTYPRSDGKTECCGLQAYDFRKEVCCGDEVVSKPVELAEDEWGVCCGGDVITDHETQLCCEDVIVERSSTDYSCCGTQLFNYVTETCCGTEILEAASTKECCLETETSYDPATEACCGSTVETLTDDEVTGLWENNACCSVSSGEP